MASAKGKSSSKGRSSASKRISARRPARPAAARSTARQGYAVCVRNDDYPASLELRKLYPVLEDSFAADHGMIRVIDESGEDYLYPDEFFVRVELPGSIEKALARIA